MTAALARGIRCVVLLVMAASAAAAQQPELIERTLAIVGGQAVTLSDARAAITFKLVDVGGSVDPEQTAAARLVDRELMLREVRRYAPPAPTEAAIEVRLGEIRKAFPGESLARALEISGLTEARLRAWVRDDLRTQAYLAQRFVSASTPTDVEIANAYAQQQEEFDRAGTSLAETRRKYVARLIESLDTNHDGKLSRAEANRSPLLRVKSRPGADKFPPPFRLSRVYGRVSSLLNRRHFWSRRTRDFAHALRHY